MAYNPQNANGQATMANSAPVVIASNQSAVSVDTELTAAAALADATANPTISNLASLLMGFNGTTWDRLRATTTRGLQVQTENPAAAALADATANPTTPLVGGPGLLFNQSTWDRARNNYGVQLSGSSARTASFQIAGTNFNAKGAYITLNITAVSGTTPTLVTTIESQDPGSTNWQVLLTAASRNATGTDRLVIYPGIAEVASQKASLPLPRTWRVNCTIAGTTPSFTMTVGVEYVN